MPKAMSARNLASAPVSMLVIDTDPGTTESIRNALNGRPVNVIWARDRENVLSNLEKLHLRAVLLALTDPTDARQDLMHQIQQAKSNVSVAVISHHWSPASIVRIIKAGADDFFVKPFSGPAILEFADRLIAAERDSRFSEAALADLQLSALAEPIVGHNPLLIDVIKRARMIAPVFSTAVIGGETGTGKELLARAIHTWSGRKGPFLAANCAAVAETLFESELFGHKKGSFTGAFSDHKGIIESADGGVLMLDEVGELSLGMQAKVLRFLQRMEIQPVGASVPQSVDIQVLAATHRNLRQMVAAGTFREDLFYRISMVEFRMPELRNRLDDLPCLIAATLSRLSKLHTKPGLHLTRRAAALFSRHSWPGNIRELENCLGYAAMITETSAIDISVLPEYLLSPSLHPAHSAKTLAEIDEDYALAILDRCNGNRSQAAEVLGIGRATLYRLLARVCDTSPADSLPHSVRDEQKSRAKT